MNSRLKLRKMGEKIPYASKFAIGFNVRGRNLAAYRGTRRPDVCCVGKLRAKNRKDGRKKENFRFYIVLYANSAHCGGWPFRIFGCNQMVTTSDGFVKSDGGGSDEPKGVMWEGR